MVKIIERHRFQPKNWWATEKTEIENQKPVDWEKRRWKNKCRSYAVQYLHFSEQQQQQQQYQNYYI